MTKKAHTSGKESVLALAKLLWSITKSPNDYMANIPLVQSLNSQGKIAHYSDIQTGISSSSLNTLKRNADLFIPGGFLELDNLRKAALNAVTKTPLLKVTEKKDKNSQLKSRLAEFERLNILLKEDLLLLTMIFDKSLRQGRSYADRASQQIQAICKKEQTELLDMFKNRKLLSDLNVVHFYER
jgi:hypothetical protein